MRGSSPGGVVYYALVSLVPLLLLLFSALGLMLRFSDFAAATEQQVLRAVEQRFGTELMATIGTLLDRLQQGSIVASSISLIGLLWTASVLFRQLRLGFRAIWKHTPPLMSGSVRLAVKTTFLEQAFSFLMVITGGLLLIAALLWIGLVQWLGGLLTNRPLLSTATTWLLVLPGPMVIVLVTFALLFRFLPPVRLPWRHVSLAAVLCAVGWFIASEVLALYGTFFGHNLSTYGAIGGVMVIMLWMNVSSQLLFYSAELCKVVATLESVDRAAPPLQPS